MRRTGCRRRLFLIVISMNLLWSRLGSTQGLRVCRLEASAGQRQALARLEKQAWRMTVGESDTGEVPRSPAEPWARLVESAKINYQGETVEVAEWLT